MRFGRHPSGQHAAITVFVKGTEDAHFTEARPSFVKALAAADLLVLNGLDLEVGWLPALLHTSRNANVQPGAPGYLDASTQITPLEIPNTVDRSMGDVHAQGNPHYLLDPINGLVVARAIARRLAALDPSAEAFLQTNLAAFERKLAAALVGELLATSYGPQHVEKLALLFAHGRLADFLASQQQAHLVGGWIGALLTAGIRKAVDEHNLWPYLAHRFRIEIVGHLEPKPGIPPTTRHTASIIETMRRENVRLILSAPYYNPRYARFVAGKTGAKIVELSHQVGARPGTGTYLRLIDHNVRALIEATR